jgi:Cu2+-exporting ATPase
MTARTATWTDLGGAADSARPAVGCEHCGAEVPKGAGRFCCGGCAVAREAIAALNLDGFYALRADSEAVALPARSTGSGYAEFDDPAWQAVHVRNLAGGACEASLWLEDVNCAACLWLVERAVTALPGVREARLDLGNGVVAVTWDPVATHLSAVGQRLDRIGHPPHAARGQAAREAQTRQERALLARIGVAWAVAGNAMVLSLALYAGLFDGMDADLVRLFRQASAVIVVPSLLWTAWPFLRGAWVGLRTRSLHMDLPVAIGLIAGVLGGLTNVVRDRGEIYFDSLASLTFLLLGGRWLQLRQRRLATEAAEAGASLAPSRARLWLDGSVTEVPVEALQVGDLLEVRAGDALAVDGVVVEGISRIDTAILTGESRPRTLGPGDRGHAGTINLGARILLRAEATGAATRVGRLVAAIAEASRRRPAIVQLADRMVRWFVTVVLGLAGVTALLWAWLDPARALEHAVALLVVTCPCALGLATPLALSMAVGRAARSGLLVKGGDVLERLAKPGLLLFDKTGTLTEGRMRLVQWHGDRTVRAAVRALERHSAHPLAVAMVEGLDDAADLHLTTSDVTQTTGAGIEGRIEDAHVAIGSPAWLGHCRQSWEVEAAIAQVLAAGASPVVVAREGEVVAVAGLGDPLRADAAGSLVRLRNLGFQLGILSGDDPRVVAAVGRQLGLDPQACQGGASPEAKLAAVLEARILGPVFLVGDGVNDAAALAAATVGIAVHGGAEASLQAADAFLARPGVAPLVDLIEGSRRSLGLVRRGLIFALAYNVVGAGLSMAGLMHPLAAAVMMPLSSLTVLANAVRGRSFGGK